MKRRANALFSSADMEVLLLADSRFPPRGRRHLMMPAEGVWRIDRSRIQRSAWKGYSPKFAPRLRSEAVLCRLPTSSAGYRTYLARTCLANSQGGREHERWQGNLRRRDPHLYLDLACALRHGQARVGDLRGVVGSDHPQLGPEPLRGRLGTAQAERCSGIHGYSPECLDRTFSEKRNGSKCAGRTRLGPVS